MGGSYKEWFWKLLIFNIFFNWVGTEIIQADHFIIDDRKVCDQCVSFEKQQDHGKWMCKLKMFEYKNFTGIADSKKNRWIDSNQFGVSCDLGKRSFIEKKKLFERVLKSWPMILL